MRRVGLLLHVTLASGSFVACRPRTTFYNITYIKLCNISVFNRFTVIKMQSITLQKSQSSRQQHHVIDSFALFLLFCLYEKKKDRIRADKAKVEIERLISLCGSDIRQESFFFVSLWRWHKIGSFL